MKMAIRDVKERVAREGVANITGAIQTADGLFEELLEIEEKFLMGEV